MRKNVLALSIAAMIGGLGFAGAASAAVIPGTTGPAPEAAANATAFNVTNADSFQLSEGGVGHILLVPYFTAQNGNMTVLHVVNTDTSNGKAVKVRFRGASNSDDLLDFQVFLSPGDVWTAAVSAGQDGTAQLVTADNTCTVPRLEKNVPQPFITARLNPNADAANQSREGYVEIFNIADIPNDKNGTIYTVDGKASAKSELYTLTKHVNGVAPCSSGGADWSALEQIAITDFTGNEAGAAAVGFNTPSGGLLGDWYIINVPQTTTFSGADTAVRATDSTASSTVVRGNFVHFPQDDGDVAPTAADTYTADPLFRTTSVDVTGAAFGTTPALVAGNYDFPDLSTPYLAGVTDPLEQAGNLTQALAVQSVTNQYATDPTISAKTDWVFSLPTRRYSVAANYAILSDSTNTVGYANAKYRLFSDLSVTTGTPAAPWFFYTGASGAPSATTNTSVDTNGNICVKVTNQVFYDREETTQAAPTGSSVFSPSKPGAPSVFSLCGETSVLAFKDAGVSVLGASDQISRQTASSAIVYENGWGVVNTSNGGNGLPLLGASFIKLTNPNANAGISGTYGITWPHRFTK